MAATTSIYKVHFHFENNKQKSSPDYIEYISASGPDYNSLRSVLSNNSKLRGSGTLVIDAVQSVGPDSVLA